MIKPKSKAEYCPWNPAGDSQSVFIYVRSVVYRRSRDGFIGNFPFVDWRIWPEALGHNRKDFLLRLPGLTWTVVSPRPHSDLSALGMQHYRNELISSRFSLWLEVQHVVGENFFDDPTVFGWVIEKGQVPGIHLKQPGFWHRLNRPAHNT